MTILSAREGYRLWAPTYAGETAISFLEDQLVTDMTPPLAGLRLLDAGCGTGRRLCGIEGASAIGVDLSPEMIEAGRGANAGAGIQTMTGDIRALPLPDRAFDVVWCRLVIGHLPECNRAYAELARVSGTGGWIIVTDFHPEAYAAGHRRSFRSGETVHEVEHYVHRVSEHLAAAHAARLVLADIREARIGPAVRSFYDEAGRGALYEEHVGLPVVLALALRRHD